MKKLTLLALVASTYAVSCAPTTPQAAEQKLYEPTWESLAEHTKAPEWFKDSKFGIYYHWGIYSVPAFDSEWYPRWMYFPNRKGWGETTHPHHIEKYGSLDEFNYHDFIPMFKAEKFDPAEWAELFEATGARFAGPVAIHHDGFSMWDSEINPWNCGDEGPKRDLLGEIYKELEKRDIHTIATFHHARNLQRYAKDTLNWGGENSHYPYNPEYITSTTDPKLKYLYGNLEEEEGNKYWLDLVDEVIDKYQPDIIWYDSWLDCIPMQTRCQMVANQFNAGVKRGEETIVVNKQQDLPLNIAINDIEQGGMIDMPEDYWMTDITLSYGSWCYTEGQAYKKIGVLLRNMIDVWSKKGIVLLNISPRADGVIVEAQQKVMLQLGDWLDKYGEAIYDTRSYTIFGYGDAAHEDGHFGGQSATMQYTANDVRFTTSKDGKSLYAIVLGMPAENSKLVIKHVANSDYPTVKNVSVVASNKSLGFSLNGDTLTIDTPTASEMNDIATAFKIEFK